MLFPFGYGLSYTTFEITETGTQKKKDGIKVVVRVKNTGAVPGKEVAQVYWSKMDQEGCEHPMQALGGFEKTSQLAPGEEEVLSITIPWKELAVYEEERAAWCWKRGVCTACGKLFQKYGLWKIYANRTGLCSGAM